MPLKITAMALLWRLAKIFLALFFWPLTLGRLFWSLTPWLRPICPSCRLPESSPSASLSSLSDVSLLSIFSHLPVVDLLHAHCLSKQLKNLASSAARQRRSLILDDGTWSISYFTYTIPPTNVHPAFRIPWVQFIRLPKVESSRRVPLRESNPAILRLQKSLASQEFACQSTSNGTLYWQPLMRFYSAFRYWQPLMRLYSAFLPWQPPTTHLATIFPTINRLYISMEGDLNDLYTIVRLLKTWGPSLGRLHLRFRLYDPEAYGESTMRHFYTSFLVTMNAFSAPLRHLHLDMHLGWFFTFQHPNDCHLPLVNQLESLYYRTFTYLEDNFAEQPMRELVHQLAPGASHPSQVSPLLRRIAFDNGTTLNALLQMPANLAGRLVKVVIGDFRWSYPTIDENTLPDFTRVCLLLASQGEGGSLEELSLSCSVPLYKIVAAISPLRKLRHLQISARGPDGSEPELPPQGRALLEMPSVRSLALHHSHLSHAYMERLYLPVHFPELRVVSVLSKAWHCADCGYMMIREGDLWDQPANFNLQLVRQCEQAEDAFLCQTLPNLQALSRTRRTGWYVYEATPVQYAPWN